MDISASGRMIRSKTVLKDKIMLVDKHIGGTYVFLGPDRLPHALVRLLDEVAEAAAKRRLGFGEVVLGLDLRVRQARLPALFEEGIGLGSLLVDRFG